MVAITNQNIIGILTKLKHVYVFEFVDVIPKKQNMVFIVSSLFKLVEDVVRTKLFHTIVYVTKCCSGEGHTMESIHSYKSNEDT
jgi:hypothetical protein